MKSLAFFLATTAFAAVPAAAQTQPAEQEAQAPARADPHHDAVDEEIVITGHFVRELNVLAGTSVLSGEALTRDIRPQLGETLARLPGVSATSFSPGSSRPVLRGFQGERVRVLTDGIGSIDVSNTSADHAVTIDPLTAERIEVLHGPAVLLFGSQAIGGAVNVFDRRIPRRAVPEDPLHIDVIGTYGSAADERSIGGGVDFTAGDTGLVFHVDGSYRRSDDLRVGGFILSPRLRAEQLEIAQEEAAEGHDEEAAEALEFASLRGRLPNSFTETRTLGAGVALIRDGGSLGISISHYDSRYGVPTRPGLGHHHEEDDGGENSVFAQAEEDEGGHGEHGDVTIDLSQVRADLRGEVELGGFFQRLRTRLGGASYEHTEFEGEEVGTVFRTEGMEGRLELVQAERNGWRGVIGGQFFVRDFVAVGEEAFVPPNATAQFGLFTLQEVEIGAVELEGALRYEHTDVASVPLGIERRFHNFSAAAGLSYGLTPSARIGFNLSRAERAPAAEELFSNGPHIATQAFELGNPDLTTESSLGGELYARVERPRYHAHLSLFYNRFDNFIYQAATGEEEDELPVFEYRQQDATHWGIEFGGSARIFDAGPLRVSADAVVDYVEATLAGGAGPVPRIPPLRVLAGIEGETDSFTVRGEVERVFRQERVAELETPTDGFTLVNASLVWRPWAENNRSSIILSANNIFDVEARRHASFTREFVPLPGRDLRVAARFSF